MSYLPSFLLLSVMLPLVVLADCAPRSEMEKVYCQLQKKGERLPPIDDFRRNDANVQALLLKRAANKHGIALPRAVKTAAALNKKAVAHKPAPKNTVKPAVKKAQAISYSHGDFDLGGCQLRGRKIQCSGGSYQLLDNQQNRHLDQSVFSEGYKMGLSNYSGSLRDKAAFNRYLADSYNTYINRMLDIGLAASTMSYTKFFYTFEDAQQKGHDFSERFDQMYAFLKNDKKSMGVKSRYSDEFPASIDQCSVLSSELVVCDNVTTNWVYRKF